MPTLAFKVQADYEKVMRLREEIHKLKEEMKGVDAVNNPHQFNVLNQNLQQCTKEYNNLTTEAVKAGTKIESGFKKKIYDAQQVVNKFSEDIMAQKKIVYDTSEEYKKLTARYNELKRQGKKFSADGMLPQLNRVKSALDEQKRSLFELTQERSKSQLGLKKLREEYQLFAKESGASTGILAKLKQEITGLGMSMMAGWGLKELGAQIIRVRGQFQQADTAIQTLLGSKERANDLLAKVREYAKISPLEFGDITRATQMMLGFNIEAEKVPGFIKAIGDVSMGESSRFNSLTLAFSQMSATGKLMGQDLLQMINAGFNPLTVMAEKTGKSVAQLKEEMSKGAISAEMVQQAFIDATSAGGKFFNMSENAAKTINGQLSMMHDALDASMNDIGKASEGVIVGAISGVTKLIENYEQLGRILVGLVTTYGSYRVALSLVTFAENGHTLAMTMARAQILLTQKAQALLNATMLANPYVLAAASLGGLIGLLIATSDSLDAAEHAQKNFNSTIEENNKKVQEDKEEIDKLLATLTDENEAQTKRTTAYQTLIDKYPEIFAKYKTEKELIDNLTEARKRENVEIQKKAQLLSQQQYDDAKQRAKDLRRLQQLFNKAHLTGKEMTEKDALQRKYNDYIRDNGGNGLIMSNAVNKAADAAQKEFNLNVDENRKKQVAERNKRYKEMKKEEAEAEKKRISALIKKANEAGKKYIALGGDDEPVSVDQAKTFVQTLNENLGTTRKTLKDWRKGAEEEAKKNKKTQQDLEESTELLTKEEAQKKIKDATANNQKLDAEAKSFKVQDKAGDAAKKKEEAEAKKKIEAEEKLQKFMDKQKLAEERAAKDLEFSTRDAEISAMQEGHAKVIAQLELNRDKQLDAIERAYEDLRQKRIDEAKQLWDADPSNNGKNFFESDKFKYAASDERYTQAETANRDARIKAVTAGYEKALKDQREAEIQSMREYLKEYGNLEQQIDAIKEDYKDKIDKARAKGDEGTALSLEKKLQEDLANVKLSNLQHSSDYVRAFENLGNASSETLKSLIGKFEEAKEAAAVNLKPDQLQVYSDILQRMYDELDNRNPFDTVVKSLKELATAQEGVKKAQTILNDVKAGKVVINPATGKAYTDTEATKELTNAKEKEAKVYTRLTKATMACADRLNSFAGTLNQIGDTIGGKLGTAIGAFGNILGSVGDAWGSIKNINTNATGIEKFMGQVSAVTGTVSAMIEMNRQLDSILPDRESLYEHYAEKQRKINEERRKIFELEIEQLQERLNNESWFYENGLTQLKKNAQLNAEYAKAYGEIAAAPQEVYQNASSGFSKWAPAIIGAIVGIVAGVITFGAGAGAGAALGAAIGSAVGGTAIGAALGSTVIALIGTAIFSGVGAALGNAVRAGIDGIMYEEGQTAAINNMRVQTRHKTFFRSEKTQDLQSWVKENWGQELFEEVKGVNLVDPEVAKKILEDGPTLVGETRETLEKLLEYSEKIRDFLEDVHEYVSEAFSPLVDNLTDALFDWLANGEDVLDKFREYAADTFKDIARDALKAMITKNIFEPFQEQLEDLTIAYSTGQLDETAYMAGVAAFAKQAQQSIEVQLPVLQNAAQVIDMALKEAGIDITGQTTEGVSDKSATISMAEKATYDQFDTYLGIATAQQIAQEQIKDRLDSMTGEGFTLMGMSVEQIVAITSAQRDIADESRDILAKSYLELQEANEHLGKIEKSVETINTNVSETRKIINDRL